MNNDVKVKDLKRIYDADFVPSQEYLDSMPDLQNSKFEGIPIEFVGIQNYQIPITIKQRDGGTQQVLASLYGEVDCDSDATFVIDYAHNGASLESVLSVLSAYEPKRIICYEC